MQKIVVVSLLVLALQSSYAQNASTGGWDVLNIEYRHSERLFFYGELQARSGELADQFFYHEAKAGIGYTLPRKLSVMLAVGDYRTYAGDGNFKDLDIREFRMWQQLSFKTDLHPLSIEHRYRIEQRWRNGTFRNRFRYRLSATIPINRKTIIARTLYASVYDEVFFTNRAPYFERNRAFAGAGYQFSDLLAFQAGLLRQFDYRKADDGSAKNYLQASLLFSLERDKKGEPHHPSTLD